MFGAPKFGGLFTKMRREKLEEELKSQTCTDTYLIEKIQKPSENLNNEKICKKPLENSLEMNTSDSEVTENVQIDKKIISENIVSPVRGILICQFTRFTTVRL